MLRPFFVSVFHLSHTPSSRKNHPLLLQCFKTMPLV